jgi:hypothetical protein
MVSRARCRAIVASVAMLGVGGMGACVLADPPAALPTTAIVAPRILDVTPTAGLLDVLPSQFVLAVAVDPRAAQIAYVIYVDQVPRFALTQNIEADGGPVLVTVNDPTFVLLLPEECHTLEITVSYPTVVGGDSVTWFYSPTQSFADCPVYDAGPAVVDGSDDAQVDAPNDAAAGND